MSYLNQGSSTFFSCALTVNVIGFVFLLRYPDEITRAFWCFAQFSCEISGWNVMLFWCFLRALRVRVSVCLAVVRCLDEMPWFLASEFCCWWCDVRTMERCVLKEGAGDWVYTMVYWTLRGFECASLVVRWRGNECNLGGGGWCKCKCVGRQKGFVLK